MAFGESITALLETYSNCLSLLKALRHRAGSDAATSEDQHASLRKSLKSDRAQVDRAYTSRLSEAGSRLEKGDEDKDNCHECAANIEQGAKPSLGLRVAHVLVESVTRGGHQDNRPPLTQARQQLLSGIYSTFVSQACQIASSTPVAATTRIAAAKKPPIP
ncbi:hypothetical protein B0T25DRAFT_600243 [Lasiosphaeria hispida]|uniref:Uncharacterized protein n=1 Tax=Lasiosphaeria hispida TaxID=260671 RepID=A0AAJ0HQ91_9PEZI|nr:hypothetical protein B0T25DRAFT_600243 [Lasiosphaeria hispida]